MSILPEKFRDFMQQKLRNEFPEFIASLQLPSPISIRVNPGKKNSLFNSTESIPWSEQGKYLTARPSFTLDPLFHAGTYYVQEASSMFLEQVFKQTIDLRQSINVLDLSAAPGGKSTHILSLLSEQSLLVSNEVIRSRASILSENIQKWGYPNVVVTNNDPKDFEKLYGFFDVILIDAPCSGEGLFRKDTHAIQEWSPQNVDLCSSRQKRILRDVWPALKENGVLIYCTCTYNERENEDNLVWLNREHEVEYLKLNIEDQWGVKEVLKDSVIAYRFFPHLIRGEGFFISVMRKKETTDTLRIKTKRGLPIPSKKIVDSLVSWIIESDQFKFFQHHEKMYFFPRSKAETLEFLMPHLTVINAGTDLATLKHDKLIPEHAAALSVKLNHKNFKNISLRKDEALKLLRKDQLELRGYEKGYSLVTYEGFALGWINVLENRINNLYPSEWRIRMAQSKLDHPEI